MSELGKLIRQQSFRERQAYFLIRERGSGGITSELDLGWDVVGKMINHGKCELRKIHITTANKLAKVDIQLHLNEDFKFDISGFPCCLFDDGKDVSSTYALLQQWDYSSHFIGTRRPMPSSSRRWAARSNSTNAQRRKAWQPPQRTEQPAVSAISNYASPDYVMGANTEKEVVHVPVEIEGRELPPLPPQEMDAGPYPVPTATAMLGASNLHTYHANANFQYQTYPSQYDVSPLETVVRRDNASLEPPPPHAQRFAREPVYLSGHVTAQSQVYYQETPRTVPIHQGQPVQIPYRSMSQRVVPSPPMFQYGVQRSRYGCFLHGDISCPRCA